MAFVTNITEKIEDAETTSALIPFIEQLADSIDGNNLKKLLKDAVLNSDPEKIKKIHYSMNSIETVLPANVLQHIESFNHFPPMNSVSRIFKECFDLNERMLLRARELSIEKELNTCKTNIIWKIEEDDEEALKIAIARAQNGDTILIDDGYYVLEDNTLFTDKMLQIIGIGDDVTIELPDYEEFVYMLGCKLYFKHITICTMNNGLSMGLYVCSGNSLWIEDCEIHTHFYGITVGEKGHLCVTNSRFTGKNDAQSIAMEKKDPEHLISRINSGNGKRKVEILNCIFFDYSGRERSEPIISFSDTHWGADNAKIIGNCFVNVNGLPIGYTRDPNGKSEDCMPMVRKENIHSNQISYRKSGLLRYVRFR